MSVVGSMDLLTENNAVTPSDFCPQNANISREASAVSALKNDKNSLKTVILIGHMKASAGISLHILQAPKKRKKNLNATGWILSLIQCSRYSFVVFGV